MKVLHHSMQIEYSIWWRASSFLIRFEWNTKIIFYDVALPIKTHTNNSEYAHMPVDWNIRFSLSLLFRFLLINNWHGSIDHLLDIIRYQNIWKNQWKIILVSEMIVSNECKFRIRTMPGAYSFKYSRTKKIYYHFCFFFRLEGNVFSRGIMRKTKSSSISFEPMNSKYVPLNRLLVCMILLSVGLMKVLNDIVSCPIESFHIFFVWIYIFGRYDKFEVCFVWFCKRL